MATSLNHLKDRRNCGFLPRFSFSHPLNNNFKEAKKSEYFPSCALSLAASDDEIMQFDEIILGDEVIPKKSEIKPAVCNSEQDACTNIELGTIDFSLSAEKIQNSCFLTKTFDEFKHRFANSHTLSNEIFKTQIQNFLENVPDECIIDSSSNIKTINDINSLLHSPYLPNKSQSDRLSFFASLKLPKVSDKPSSDDKLSFQRNISNYLSSEQYERFSNILKKIGQNPSFFTRKRFVERYLDKKKSRNFGIKYKSRQKVALMRLREKGRFTQSNQ